MPNETPTKLRQREACCVADCACDEPANLIGADARPQCFRCGENVCKNCSSRRKYLTYGVKRLCNNCQRDMDGHDKIVMRRLYKLMS